MIYKKLKSIFFPSKKETATSKTEFLYLFAIPTVNFSNNIQQDTEYRESIIRFIQKDLLPKKTIKSSDAFVDSGQKEGDELLTYFMFASDNTAENIYFKPLLYEVFAYTKKKDINIFSYKHETILFKKNKQTLNIIKFTVDCL